MGITMNEERIYIAACGICCSVCGLYLKGICPPCGSGLKVDEEVVRKKMESRQRTWLMFAQGFNVYLRRKQATA